MSGGQPMEQLKLKKLMHSFEVIQLLTYAEVDMDGYLTVNILTDAEWRSI